MPLRSRITLSSKTKKKSDRMPAPRPLRRVLLTLFLRARYVYMALDLMLSRGMEMR